MNEANGAEFTNGNEVGFSKREGLSEPANNLLRNAELIKEFCDENIKWVCKETDLNEIEVRKALHRTLQVIKALGLHFSKHKTFGDTNWTQLGVSCPDVNNPILIPVHFSGNMLLADDFNEDGQLKHPEKMYGIAKYGHTSVGDSITPAEVAKELGAYDFPEED